MLVTGAAGQDGTILATLLHREGHEVLGLVKPGSDTTRLLAYVPSLQVIECELMDVDAVHAVVRELAPDQVFNLGAFSAPGESWMHEEEVRRTNVDPVRAMLAALAANAEQGRLGRFVQASSSHVYEGTDRSPQDETFELTPGSPYARSKAEALELVRRARDEQGLFAVSAIMYNHESPLRTENFVTRRVTKAVARISAGLQDVLELGDIDVARDWGWAPDYVRGMRLMASASTPRDYVLATGVSHRLSFFVAKAFKAVGITEWPDRVVSSKERERPNDTNRMVGNPRAAYVDLGWRHTVDFDDIAGRMVRHDVRLLEDPDARWEDF